MPRLEESDLEKVARSDKSLRQGELRWLPPQSSVGIDEISEEMSGGSLGGGGATWEMAAASL